MIVSMNQTNMKNPTFTKTDFSFSPGGNVYEWKEAETRFTVPKSGKYVIAITASAKNGKQNSTGDDDDLRVVINGYEFGKHENHEEKMSWHGFGTSFENSVELWYDEIPILGVTEIHLLPSQSLEKYLYTNYSLSIFLIPSKNDYLILRTFILSSDFNKEKNKSNTCAIDALWNESLEITGGDAKLASNLLVYIVYQGLAHSVFDENEAEINERIDALPNSIFDEDSDNKDKLQHFFGNINLFLRFGSGLTFSIGTGKEIIDYFGSTGFSIDDIHANLKGMQFAYLYMKNKSLNPSDVLYE